MEEHCKLMELILEDIGNLKIKNDEGSVGWMKVGLSS